MIPSIDRTVSVRDISLDGLQSGTYRAWIYLRLVVDNGACDARAERMPGQPVGGRRKIGNNVLHINSADFILHHLFLVVVRVYASH